MIPGQIVIARLTADHRGGVVLSPGESYARVVAVGNVSVTLSIAGARVLVGRGRVRSAPKAVHP